MTERCRAEKCGRPLRTDESRERGYGPVCWRRLNPPTLRAPRAAPSASLDPNQILLPLETAVDAETRRAATDTIARHALARTIDFAVDTGKIDWGDYPDLSEIDFEAVVDRVQKIAESISPTGEAYEAAYSHLKLAGD